MDSGPYSYRRPVPARWIRAVLYVVVGAGLGWFFCGDALRSAVERWRAAQRELVPPLVVTFPGRDERRPAFWHFDLVPIKVRVQDRRRRPIANVRPVVDVVRFAEGESPETPEAEPERMTLIVSEKVIRPQVPLRYDPGQEAWVGVWPVPIAAQEGIYYIRARAKLPRELVDVRAKPTGEAPRPTPTPSGEETVAVGPVYAAFEIKGREPPEVPEPLCVCTLEAETDLSKLKDIRGPDGTVGDWRKLFDWVEFIGANVLWVQGPTTTARAKKLDPDFPWLADNLGTIELFGREAKRRGLQFGVWTVAYRVVGEKSLLPRYRWGAYDGFRGSPSLWDPLRIEHLAQATRWLEEKEFVDYVGFDYLRDFLPSYDDAERFVEALRPPVPEQWEQWDAARREAWLRYQCQHYNPGDAANQDVYFGWGYWRARQTAQIVRQVVERGKIGKPLWVFTLATWHGLEHGQDPVMLRDAGVAFDAVMLYPERRRATFSGIVSGHWRPYAAAAKLNIILGNQMNDALHGRTRKPAGPEDYYLRFEEAFQACSTVDKSRVVGFYAHDLARLAVHSTQQFGPYPPSEWAIAAAACMTKVRCAWPRPVSRAAIPLTIELNVPRSAPRGKWFPADVTVVNHSEEAVAEMRAEPLRTEGVELESQLGAPVRIAPGEQAILPLRARVARPLARRANRHMVAVRLRWSGAGTVHQAVCFRYVDIK